MIVLGIESSCDDTAVAIIDDHKILAHILSSQIEIHKPYGGVVPELAARSHVEIIDQLIKTALATAKLKLQQIELIAATGGPGLIGGVITSVMVAKGISLANNIPLIFVNHLEGHALMAKFEKPELSYPFLIFLASGGHCQILACNGPVKYEKYGETLDDAIGEAFDKTAKLLGLPYPGGPYIEKLAKEGNHLAYKLPVSMVKQDNCNFSLSGLKTAVRYLIAELGELSLKQKEDIAASFQYAVRKQIESRVIYAIKKYQAKYNNINTNIVFSGGVAANEYIRCNLELICQKFKSTLYCPSTKFCTDNAVMIAFAGLENYKIGNISNLGFKPKARWPLYGDLA